MDDISAQVFDSNKPSIKYRYLNGMHQYTADFRDIGTPEVEVLDNGTIRYTVTPHSSEIDGVIQVYELDASEKLEGSAIASIETNNRIVTVLIANSFEDEEI